MDISVDNLMKEIDFNYVCEVFFEDKFVAKWVFESKLKKCYKEDTNKFKEVFSNVIKEDLKKVVYDTYKELKYFADKKAPIPAKDYERFFLKKIKNRKEIEKYSKEEILLEIPLHPIILFYKLKLRFINFGIDVDNEGIKIIYESLLNYFDINIERTQRYTKIAKLYFGNKFIFIKKQLDNDKEKDSISKLARTILNFNTKN